MEEEIGPIEGGPSALGLVGPAISAVGFIMSIKARIKTEQFQREVEKKLNQIIQEIDDLKSDLDAFEAKVFDELQGIKYSNPMVTIYAAYQASLPGSTAGKNWLELTNSAMTYQDQLVTGSSNGEESGQTLISLFLYDKLSARRDSDQIVECTSIINLAYTYFSKRVIPTSSVGFKVLAQYNYNTTDNWFKKLTSVIEGNPSTPQIQTMADASQNSISQFLESQASPLSWIDFYRTQYGIKGVSIDHIMTGVSFEPASNEVIVGVEFITIPVPNTRDSIAVRLKLHYGVPDQSGFVREIKTALQGDTFSFPVTKDVAESPYRAAKPVTLISNSELTVPDGYLIKNVAFTSRIVENDGIEVGVAKVGIFYFDKVITFGLKIEMATLNVTRTNPTAIDDLPTYSIEVSSKGWIDNIEDEDSGFLSPREVVQKLLNSDGSNALQKEGINIDFYNSDHNVFKDQKRTWDIANTVDNSLWYYPMTGVAIRRNEKSNFMVGFKSDFIKNMFNK